MKIQCPNCSNAALEGAPQTEDIRELFPRWEREGKLQFSSSTLEEYANKKTVTLYQCPFCTFKQFYPVIAGSSSFYHDITKSQYYIKEKWEFYRAIKEIKKIQPKTVLDVGCGAGAFLIQLKKSLPGAVLYGFDHNKSVHSKLSQHNINYFPSLKATDLKFDVICSFQVVEHIADPFEWLGFLSNLLKPNGFIVLTVPDNAGPVRFFPHSLTELPPHHLTRWNKKSISIFLEQRGFHQLTTKVEPLPDYLWDAYLPKIIESNMPHSMYKFCESRRLIEKVFRFLKRINRMGVKHLPIHGHTLYVTARLQG